MRSLPVRAAECRAVERRAPSCTGAPAVRSHSTTSLCPEPAARRSISDMVAAVSGMARRCSTRTWTTGRASGLLSRSAGPHSPSAPTHSRRCPAASTLPPWTRRRRAAAAPKPTRCRAATTPGDCWAAAATSSARFRPARPNKEVLCSSVPDRNRRSEAGRVRSTWPLPRRFWGLCQAMSLRCTARSAAVCA